MDDLNWVGPLLPDISERQEAASQITICGRKSAALCFRNRTSRIDLSGSGVDSKARQASFSSEFDRKEPSNMRFDLPAALNEWAQPVGAAPNDKSFLQNLVPQRPGVESRSQLNKLRDFPDSTAGKGTVSRIDGVALHAGLYQWHDFLDECHALAQSIEGEGRNHLGDYWHAIMHRREPDYSNAKYWVRHVGRNPVFEPLAQRAAEILDSESSSEARKWCSRLQTRAGWDPFAFVDLCEHCAEKEETSLGLAARRIQQQEMALLLDLTYRQCMEA